jgi:predicted TIM-barrel fold metal-dependent hydrolase
MYKIFSVDDHIIEPPDVWTSRVPAKFAAVAPRVVVEDDREYWVYEDQRTESMGLNAVAGTPREQWDMEPIRFSEMIPGCYDPASRAKELLSQGVLASVGFPTWPRFGGMRFVHFDDKELAHVCVQAWNDFVLEEWCPGGPDGLFVPMIICQAWDPRRAAEEIRRCAAKGARALAFVENPVPDGLPSFHSDFYDPIWDAIQETEIAVCLHIGSAGSLPIPDPEIPATGMLALASVAGMMSMVNLLTSRVLAKFPRLKIVFSEAGVGWIPHILERTDRKVERNHQHGGGFHGLMPSELFDRNMWACMVDEPVGIQVYESVGAHKILCETDFPHADSPYPTTQDSYRDLFSTLPGDVVEKMAYRNAEEVFRWKMADESLLVSPDVKAWREALAANPLAAWDEQLARTT